MTDFQLGKILMTRSVTRLIAKDNTFREFVERCLSRHARGDWGEIDEEYKQLNQDSLDRHLRLFSFYEYGDKAIWIITNQTGLARLYFCRVSHYQGCVKECKGC